MFKKTFHINLLLVAHRDSNNLELWDQSPQSVVCVTQVEVSGSNLSILVYLPAVSHTSPPDQTKFKILAAHYPTSPPFPKPLAFMRI